jgi:hypothetical protein
LFGFDLTPDMSEVGAFPLIKQATKNDFWEINQSEKRIVCGGHVC